MKFEINTNTLINEIMANNTSAVMLFAPPGTGKTQFLTELSSRYRTVFWFNAVAGGIDMFTYCLIDQIITEDDVLKNKLHQLLYCRSEFNGDNVIITAVLDYISKIKGNCLMVFERMERLPQNFDLALLERLIKHCPSNLKIVVSSDEYIDFDYTKFEPLYPKLIDEYTLLPRRANPDFEELLSDITEEDKAFLTYISDIVEVDIDFVRDFYPKGVELLYYLNKKDNYVSTRDGKFFRPNTLLKNYLLTLKDRYSLLNAERSKIPAKRRYADHAFTLNDYVLATTYYLELDDYDMVDKCAKAALTQAYCLMQMGDFAKANITMPFKPNKSKKNYSLFYAILSDARGDHKTAKEFLDDLPDYFRDNNEILLELISINRLIKMTSRLSLDISVYADRVTDVIGRSREVYPDYTDDFIISLLPYRKDLGITIAEIERCLHREKASDSFLYIKGVEGLANAYFDAGNYRRAMELTHIIKNHFKWYVIPHNLLAFRYYDGEIEATEKHAKEALDFALENDITKDISLLYCTLGMVDLYYGKIDEALEKYDTAVRLDKENISIKFYNIGQRCIVYAKYKDPNYAKEVAHIYLKYCESFYPQYTNMLQLALSFCWLKLGDSEKAYQYATKCVQSSKSRTTNWLLGMAIATDYMLTKKDLKDAPTLVRNILRSSYQYGMQMLVVDYYHDIFNGLISFAKQHDIESEYMAVIDSALLKKQNSKVVTNNLKVTMFGDVTASVGGKEIQWKTRKSKDLFFHYLLAKGNGIDRNLIIDLMWKDYLNESAINNLKTTNNIIRKTLAAHNIEFSLDYINSKYALTVKSLDSDYNVYCELKEKLTGETSLQQRVDIINRMLKVYKNDFALDLQYSDFNDERKSIKQDMIINLLKLIRSLAKAGEYLEAKRFLSSLNMIDRQNDYTAMMAELDEHISVVR
ncbi:MAG: hypothetical protein WC292_02685 [Clostridia bacterium]